jgi:multidrug efflux pump subunit AcrB
MSFLAAVIFSFLALGALPISLLPDIDVPQIIIRVNAPNRSPAEIEQSFLRPIREEMLSLSGIASVESQAGSQTGQVSLRFEYGKNMNLAYIESNEKIDRLSSAFPKDLSRPQVVRVNTSDIPVMRLQIVPKQAGADWVLLSELAEKVIKKRLEQLAGVSLVDINGLQKRLIAIEPDEFALQSLKIPSSRILESIQSQNLELGALSVKDGQYRYYVKLGSKLKQPQDLQKLYVRTSDGLSIPLPKIAQIRDTTERPQGFHLFNTQKALVLTIQKQSQAKTTELVPLLYEALAQFQKDYPQLDFHLTQDQSLLLRLSIQNLSNSLLLGGIFAFAILFLFMGDYRIPIIMGLSLPISLLNSFLVFYVFGISLNIISLSGLALGLGMLIDNAIIVLDNISRKRSEGLDLLQSCVEGTAERIAPLLSSVLTTLSVFIPLVFLNGLSGALFYDQAVAIGATLGMSLVVSFLFLPVLYRLFYSKKSSIPKSDSALYVVILNGYAWLERLVFKYQWVSLLLFMSVLPLAYLLSNQIGVSSLPYLDKKESQLTIFWNEPISVFENENRVKQLLQVHQNLFQKSESDIGLSQFLRQEGQNSLQKASIYFDCASVKQKEKLNTNISRYLSEQYPQASINIGDALNAFDQLFQSQRAALEMRWKNRNPNQPVPADKMTAFAEETSKNLGQYQPKKGAGLQLETVLNIQLKSTAMQRYQITPSEVLNTLEKIFGASLITELKNYGEIIPIRLQSADTDFEQKLANTQINNAQGQSYPLSIFVEVEYAQDYQALTADKTGIYHSLSLSKVPQDWAKQSQELKAKALAENLSLDFEGEYYENQENLFQLGVVLLIAILLLYFILAAQFESFWQPLLVVLTLPLGLAGSVFFLWLGNATLNIMSAIGAVVMLGIIVNDTILKIDNINRLRKTLPLLEALHQAGHISFKPVLMTSLTTILALTPVLWSGGLGADLQRPLVLAIMGGLSIGTITAIYFVPLLYYFLVRKKKKL